MCCRLRYRCAAVSTSVIFAWYTQWWRNIGGIGGPAAAGTGALCNAAAVSGWQELVWAGIFATNIDTTTQQVCVLARTDTTASNVQVWFDSLVVGTNVL
jgi:hypothetical protein